MKKCNKNNGSNTEYWKGGVPPCAVIVSVPLSAAAVVPESSVREKNTV